MNPSKKKAGEDKIEGALVDLFTRPFYKLAKSAPPRYREKLAQELYQAQMKYLPEEWLSYTIGLGLFSFSLFFPMLYFLFGTISLREYLALPFSAIFSLLIVCLNLAHPGRTRGRYAREFEADMAIGVQVLAIELNSGKRPLEAMKVIANAEYGHFSHLLSFALKQHKAGDKIQDALDKAAASINSVYARRFAVLMKNAYSISRGKQLGNPLLSLSDELVKRNEAELRVYSAKSGLFSQGATVLTIVLPTMMVSLLLVATIFSQIQMDTRMLTLLVGFGISAIAAALYMFQSASLPVFVQHINTSPNIGYIRSTRIKLHQIGYNPRTYLAASIALFFSVFLVSALISLVFSMTMQLPFLLAGFTLLFCLVYPYVQFSRMQKQLEDELPTALEQAAQFMPHSRSEKVIQTLAELDSGKLSEEFAKAQREIEAGARFDQAMEKIYEDTGSQYLKQGLELIVRSHKTGLDMRKSLLNTAEYMRKIKYIMQESKAATFSERATQAVGYLISAALFAIVLSLGTGLSKTLSGTVFSPSPGALDAIAAGIQINLLIHPIIIAWNISALENDRKRALFYAPTLLILGNLLFMSLRNLPLV